MSESKVWFITGTSSGFGWEFAEAALKRGDRVAATARKPEVLQPLIDEFGADAVIALKLDVTEIHGYRLELGLSVFTDEARDTLVNPVVIFEVLSDSSEKYDRGDKFEQYQRILKVACLTQQTCGAASPLDYRASSTDPL